MSERRIQGARLVASVATILGLVSLIVASVAAQSAAPEQKTPTPKLPDGKPDLTGVWQTVAPRGLPYGFRRCGPYQVDCDAWVIGLTDPLGDPTPELVDHATFWPSAPSPPGERHSQIV